MILAEPNVIPENQAQPPNTLNQLIKKKGFISLFIKLHQTKTLLI